MKKCLIVTVILLLGAITAFAAPLFDYRGVFPADRVADAKITNYMLLKEASKIRFEVDEQGQNQGSRIKIVKVQLTSEPGVVFADPAGISELQLPKTGIYEITLVPVIPAGSEIRFVLKVMEVEKTTASKISNSWQPESELSLTTVPAAIATVTSAIKVVETIQDSGLTNLLIPTPGSIASSPSVTPIEETLASMTLISSEAAILQPVVQPANLIAAGMEDDNSTGIILESPVADFFLNPFNGFRFRIEDPMLQNIDMLQKYIRIMVRSINGTEIPVKGSFFSPEPEIFVFMPEKTIPGCVYTVEISAANSLQKKILQTPVFPQISTEFVRSGPDLKVRIFWEKNPDLVANPSGQMISLAGCRIVLNSATEEILQLDVNQNFLPFGAVGVVTYRAAPFELELTLPSETVIKNGCNVEILAAFDGSNTLISAFRSSWQPTDEEILHESLIEEDYSDSEAVYLDTVASEAKVEEIAEEIIPLASMPVETSFTLHKSFSLLESEQDFALAWPQDIKWDDNGNIVVLDSQRRRICRFSGQGKKLRAFGNKGDGEGDLGLPVAIAVKSDGIFVSDSALHAIHHFDAEGKFVSSIKSDPVRGLVIDLPGGLCFRNDEMWVADRGNNRIMCFNTDGGFLGSFGSTTAAPIVAPVSIRADTESLFILEKSGLVKKFSPMGRFDATFQTGCGEALGFDVDDWAGIWVCDAEKFRVLRFSANGRLLTELAAPPTPKTWLPTAVAVRKDGKVVVADAQNKMLHIFVPGK